MDFTFFESLTKKEAEVFLDNYLNVESKAAAEMIIEAERDGIKADFSIQSTSYVLKWILYRVKTVPQKMNSSLPEWIRGYDSYVSSIIDFDEPSKVLILRASYYLGESFIRYSDKLSWTTGNPDTAEQNMPVITGFVDQIEMAPMLVTENLLLRIVVDGAPDKDINRAIESWLSDIPNS
jgi:hypothetical protein